MMDYLITGSAIVGVTLIAIFVWLFIGFLVASVFGHLADKKWFANLIVSQMTMYILDKRKFKGLVFYGPIVLVCFVVLAVCGPIAQLLGFMFGGLELVYKKAKVEKT